MKKILLVLIIFIILTSAVFYFVRQGSGAGSDEEGGGVLKSLSNFFPNSSNRDISIDNPANNLQSASSTNSASTAQVRDLTSKFDRIATNPVIGAFMASAGNIWYAEKATGNFYSYDLLTGQTKQLSNTTWPGGQELYAGQTKSGPEMILRRNRGSSIENYKGKISNSASSTEPGELILTPLNLNISNLAVSPSKNRYYYQIASFAGTTGYIAGIDGSGPTTKVFSSQYPRWNVFWPNENIIFLQTAPLSEQKGQLYSLDVKTKTTSQVLTGIIGLTSLPAPDGKKILFAGNDLRLRLKYTKSSEAEIVLGISTMPEKCVWSADSAKVYCAVPNSLAGASYPDSWYQGTVSFSDAFWVIDTTTGTTKQLYNPADSAEKILVDGISLFLTPNQLFLINKVDDTLWRLNLAEDFAQKTSSSTNQN